MGNVFVSLCSTVRPTAPTSLTIEAQLNILLKVSSHLQHQMGWPDTRSICPCANLSEGGKAAHLDPDSVIWHPSHASYPCAFTDQDTTKQYLTKNINNQGTT